MQAEPFPLEVNVLADGLRFGRHGRPNPVKDLAPPRPRNGDPMCAISQQL
jgi:hypothetical protein